MSNLIEYFRSGGPIMWPILLVALIGLAASQSTPSHASHGGVATSAALPRCQQTARRAATSARAERQPTPAPPNEPQPAPHTR